MSRGLNNSYVRVPARVSPLELIEDVRLLLAKSDEFARSARIQYRSATEWICVYEGGFLSLKEQARIEALRLLTQKVADEVVMVAGYSGLCTGAYGHFVEGAFVRFLTRCEDWSENFGSPEPWERELIEEPGITDRTIYRLGDLLRLPSCRIFENKWDVDLAIR